MKHLKQCSPRSCSSPAQCTTMILLGAVAMFAATAYANLDSAFTASPLKSHALNWYWLNASLDDATTDFQLTALRDSCGFSGIAPCFSADNWFDNPNFVARFRHLMDKCKDLGMNACVNDDYYFPSGTAKSKTPWSIDSRRIKKTEQDVTGPLTYQTAVPAGTDPGGTDDIFLGCAAMSNSDHSILYDISTNVTGHTLTWSVPAGSWKVMVFATNHGWSGTNFLSATAVQTWVNLTYQRLYDAVPDHFGSTIHSMFFDDVSTAANGWVDDYNTQFQAKHGFSPVKYYPALWYDIGANTAAARNLLFGFLNDLFARNFGGTVAKWCADHNVEASGHYASVKNTDGWIGVAGDPIKFYKYIQRIGTEGWRFMGVSYKIPSSARYLYDKPLMVNQNYALIWDYSVDDLYRMGMESFARGITTQYADGAQNSDPVDESFMRPELSWRNTLLAPELPTFTKWTGRCQMLLEGGRHVADIALLFPMAAYNGECYIGHEEGTSDYVEVAESLSCTIRRDYTFMHPEVLDSNCTIDAVNHTINLNNRVNYEKYKVFIIPGSGAAGAIHASTMRKAKEFYDNGGVIICTSKLPYKSAELGQDSVVVNRVMSIFGLDAQTPGTTYKKNTNANSGKAYFIQNISERVNGVSRLQWALDDAVPVWDVKFTSVTPAPSSPVNYPFSYLHQVLNNVDYYFLANSSDKPITTQVQLRGRMIRPQIMDPHTGTIANVPTAQFQSSIVGGQNVTTLTITIGAVKSLFIRDSASTATVGHRGLPQEPRSARIVDVVLRTSQFSTIRLGTMPSIDKGGILRMEIFGMDGRLVGASDRHAGSGAVVFTLGNGVQRLTFGMYVCRIKAAGIEKAIAFAVTR